MLDLFIYKIGAIILALSFLRRESLLAAAILCVTFLVNEYTFDMNPTWSSLESRAKILALVNFAGGFILLSRLRTPEFAIGLIFIGCSFYFQAMLVEIQNQVLSLKNLRPSFMTVATALQLATVIFILIQGSADNGGKRAKHRLFSINGRFHNFLYPKTSKAKP